MRIGTRASALAIVQARSIAHSLGEEELVRAEIVEVTTSGDRGENFSDKARWTSELEFALLDGRIDVAVHSAKDVPADLAQDTQILIPPREDPRDVICGAATLAELAPGARVGTASLRRGGQIKALRPDLQIVELRGNVDTRLRKLAEGQADAIVIAYAGLKRLGLQAHAGGFLDALVPAAAQGALALQVRSSDSTIIDDLSALVDADATLCVTAERAFTSALGASCHTAVGAYASSAPAAVSLKDGPGGAGQSAQPGAALAAGHVKLSGWVGLPDGSEWIADACTGTPHEAATLLAERMIAVGAKELLQRAEEAAQ